MELENLAVEAKEQDSPQVGLDLFYRDFHKHNLDVAEQAWEFYESLSAEERAKLRAYKPHDERFSFNNYLKMVQSLKPSGIARVAGQHMLAHRINEELRKIPILEKITYLNGGQLLIW